jgi:hypothetical protein
MEWRPVPGFSKYECSSEGEIRRKFCRFCGAGPGKLLKQVVQKSRYMYVGIPDDDGVPRTVTVHRLICAAFHGPPPTPSHQTAHSDGDRGNNIASNLRWATIRENWVDRVKHGTHRNGAKINTVRLSKEQVIEIRRAYKTAPFKEPGKNRRLAEKYGVSLYCIEDIVYERSWRQLLTTQP